MTDYKAKNLEDHKLFRRDKSLVWIKIKTCSLISARVNVVHSECWRMCDKSYCVNTISKDETEVLAFNPNLKSAGF